MTTPHFKAPELAPNENKPNTNKEQNHRALHLVHSRGLFLI